MAARTLWTPEPSEDAHPSGEPMKPPGVRAGCLLGVVALVLFVGAMFFAGSWFSQLGGFLEDTSAIPALALTGIALLALLPFFELLAVLSSAGRARARLGLACFGGALGVGAMVLIDHPIIHEDNCTFWIGYDNPGVMFGPLLTIILAVGGGVLGVSLGNGGERLVRAAGRTRPALRWVAWGSWATVAALVLLSLSERGRRPDPTVASYVTSLPEVGRLPPADPSRPDPGRRATFDAFSVIRTEFGGVGLIRNGAPDSTLDTWPNVSVGISIRRDASHGLLILESDVAKGTGVHGPIGQRAAFREKDLLQVDVEVADLGDLTGPPAPWIFAALIGLIVALIVMLRERGLVGALSRISDYRTGVANDNGRIVLEDGIVSDPEAESKPIPLGPVVVIPRSAPRSPTYRTTTSLEKIIVVPGTTEDVTRFVNAAAVNRYLLAIAALSVTALPLVSACVRLHF